MLTQGALCVRIPAPFKAKRTLTRKDTMPRQHPHPMLLAAFMFFFSAPVSASDEFLLCGPDEDGCYEEISQWCACIPYNREHGESEYCLDFDKRTCRPLHEIPECTQRFIFPNQATCLATLFQSSPSHPCEPVNREYCLSHGTPFCAPDGYPTSCHPSESG